MSSTTATWSPSSPQLRLALRCRNCKESRAVLVRARTRKLDCRHVRLLSVARSRSNGPERRRRRDGVSRIVVDSTAGADAFSGWSGSDNVEDAIDSKRNRWFRGIMGAGPAGLVLVAGLSFAAMSLSNRSTSSKCFLTAGPKQQLEPLTAHQEVSLASDNESDKVENENETGIHEDLSSPSEFNGISTDNKLDNDNGTYLVDSYTSNRNTATKTVLIQEDLQNISALDGMSVGPNLTPMSPK